MANVLKKLMECRIALNGMDIKKTGKNRNMIYFELRDFLPQTMKLFSAQKLAGFISFGQEVATLKIVDLEDGSEVDITSPMSSCNLPNCHPVQNLGAVQTYLRRYLWTTAMELLESDQLDSSIDTSKTRTESAGDVISSRAYIELENAAKKGRAEFSAVWKKIKEEDRPDSPEVIKRLKKLCEEADHATANA